ncbi:Env9p [Sugiyamaella lignohabitans]|uniref:Env9p n=1 Tax=Sugiyamaella lignohabitans TaxID=796027 RepID=A0A167E6B8_9ASCO|nr:Env9p [Sugiyamaella lignohabitans]ANB13698.1 Env9p [Sugiyamaella lignohabitans]
MVFFGPCWSVDSLPDFSGKSVFITGGNTGIGKHTVTELARKNMGKIYLAGRNPTRCEAAIAEIKKEVPNANIEYVKLDVSKLDDVKQVAEKFVNEHTSLNYLVNNAGIMATPYELNNDGYEMQFATNYMGHALLTRIMLPLLEKTAKDGDEVKIINVSSFAHNFAPRVGINFEDVNLTKGSVWDRYGQSKLANILLNNELTKRYPQIKSYSLHPGFVRTDLYDGMNSTYGILGRIANAVTKPFYITPYNGAITTLYCFSVEANDKAGEYLVPYGKVGSLTRNAKNQELSSKLWDWTTNELTNKHYI